MSIKEKPLIKAVEQLGPLPGFLFAHPVLAGFISMLMCPVFGVVVMMFWGMFGKAPEAYEAARLGAIILTAFAVMIFIGIFFNAFRDREETAARLQFVFGGAMALGVIIAFDGLTVDAFRSYFEGGGFWVCTSVVQGCD
ncbi:MAG: hypothetical protein AAFW68_08910 [Pseudomonadota bacterium]